jgi:asparagine synthase (glutamine-hydrolysing)
MSVNVHLRDPGSWTSGGGVYVRGSAFDGDELLRAPGLVRRFESADSEAGFVSLLERFNGFYSVVAESDDGVRAAVDRTRSFPLFYGTDDGDAYVSDDCRWVRDRVDGGNGGPVSEVEYLLSGFVTGSDTLYHGVKQVQAGELAVVDGSGVRTEQYYRHFGRATEDGSRDELLEELDRVSVAVFERFLDGFGDRPLVVPLSGGYDSRYVLLMLKRLGHENLLAFSYGRPGNEDPEVSREVARNLGVQWEFVPYTHDDWRDRFHSDRRREFYRTIPCADSRPNLMDWPAVWELAESGAIPDDAVFVPGHTAVPVNFPPEAFLGEETVDGNTFVDVVLDRYGYWGRGEDVEALLEGKVLDTTGFGTSRPFEEAARTFQEWIWREQLSKLLTNNVNTYEFWGYDWWLPLWDAEFAAFWTRIPLRYHVDRNLFEEYVDDLYVEVAGVDTETAGRCADDSDLVSRLKPTVHGTPLWPVADYVYRHVVKRYTEYGSDPQYGIVPRDQFERMYSGRECVFSFRVLNLLDRISLDPPAEFSTPKNGIVTVEYLESNGAEGRPDPTDPRD